MTSTIREHRLALFFLTVFAIRAAAAERPNVIVVYTDDQGYGDASCLNPDAKFVTPNIDRLAREGLLFTDGHSSDTVCTPSRYGLLTGRYSWRTTLKRGVFGAERECLIADGRTTLASLLAGQGYQTAMVGKWHLGMDFPGDHGDRDWSQPTRDMPLDKGFDAYWGIPASMNYGVLAWFDGRYPETPPTLFTRKKPNDLALSDYRIMPPYEREPVEPLDLEVATDFVDSACLTRFTDQAIGRIESWSEAAHNGRPFFLYLALTSPHKPVIPIDQFRGQSDAGAYGDFILETDWHLGRLLDALDREGLAGNTLVFFSSDNGPENTWRQRNDLYSHSSAGPLREGKRSIYEGGHRVPFLVRWPDRVSPGRVWDGPVCQTDLLATLAEMLDIELSANEGEDSDSFYQVLVDKDCEQQRLPMIHHSSRGRFAIREGRWKLVMEAGREDREMYDLESDLSETRDIADEYPEIVAELVEKITGIVASGRTTPGEAVGNDTEHWDDLTWMDN